MIVQYAADVLFITEPILLCTTQLSIMSLLVHLTFQKSSILAFYQYSLLLLLQESPIYSVLLGRAHPGHLVTEHMALPFLSASTIIRFLDSCSWMRMTFSTPLTMKYPPGSMGHSFSLASSAGVLPISTQLEDRSMIGILKCSEGTVAGGYNELGYSYTPKWIQKSHPTCDM